MATCTGNQLLSKHVPHTDFAYTIWDFMCSDAHLGKGHLVVLRLGKVLEGYGAVTLGLGAKYMNMYTTPST